MSGVSCILPGGIQADIQTFPRADVKPIRAPSRRSGCKVLKGYGSTGPFYVVNGADFTASIPAPGSSKPKLNANYEAESRALSEALGIGLTTIKCT